MNIQKISLQVFFPSMFLCAGFALIAIWFGDLINESYFRFIPTMFIIGLAAFITWAVLMVIEFKTVINSKNNQ